MPTEEELNSQRDEEIVNMVANLYNLYLNENSDKPKITTHDLAYWGYGAWKISMADMHAIQAMPNVFLP